LAYATGCLLAELPIAKARGGRATRREPRHARAHKQQATSNNSRDRRRSKERKSERTKERKSERAKERNSSVPLLFRLLRVSFDLSLNRSLHYRNNNNIPCCGVVACTPHATRRPLHRIFFLQSWRKATRNRRLHGALGPRGRRLTLSLAPCGCRCRPRTITSGATTTRALRLTWPASAATVAMAPVPRLRVAASTATMAATTAATTATARATSPSASRSSKRATSVARRMPRVATSGHACGARPRASLTNAATRRHRAPTSRAPSPRTRRALATCSTPRRRWATLPAPPPRPPPSLPPSPRPLPASVFLSEVQRRRPHLWVAVARRSIVARDAARSRTVRSAPPYGIASLQSHHLNCAAACGAGACHATVTQPLQHRVGNGVPQHGASAREHRELLRRSAHARQR